MSRLTKNRIYKRKTIKGVWGIAASIAGGISVIIILKVIQEIGFYKVPEIIIPLIIINIPFITIYLLIRKKKIKFIQNDKDIFIIVLAYLKKLKLPANKILLQLERLFYSHPKGDLKKLYIKHNQQETSIYKSCKNLAAQTSEIRYFAIYSLFDIASEDGIFSVKEEEFIEEVRKLLRVHSKTFQYIRNSYIKKGIKEEHKIIEEQNRKKIAESFLPYNAYKILGVSPTVTKAQLKKVYRTLAKKYHPDKYFGQSEKVIQKAEDKFQEITEAYEIIIKYKKFD